MKKILFYFLVFSVFLMPSLSMAGGIGNPMPLQERSKFAIGIEDNFIFSKDLEKSGSVNSGEVQDTNQVIAKLAWTPLDFATLYGRLGSANLEEKYNWSNSRSQTVEFDYGFLAGGGVNLVYEMGNNLGIGWDNQFAWWNTEANSVTGNNSPSLTAKGSYDNLEFQSTIYAKYNWDLGNNYKLIPYVGVGYFYFKSKLDDTITVTDSDTIYTYGDIENDDNIGIVAGVDYALGDKIVLNVEGRFVAETAITVGGSYKF